MSHMKAKRKTPNPNELWKPLPNVHFNVSQVFQRILTFPTVGWEAFNTSPYQLRVRIEVHPILGGRDLHPLPDDDINGTNPYEVEPMSYLFANGCFSLPKKCADSKDELILEIRATVEDINDPEKSQYRLVPRRWKYVREQNVWSYYPQRPMTEKKLPQTKRIKGSKMREPKEIAGELEAIHDEMKKWLPHLERESARKEFGRLSQKEMELERELNSSLIGKYKLK